jgi:hypothetical protein
MDHGSIASETDWGKNKEQREEWFMLQTAHKPPTTEPVMLDSIAATEITPRVARLREALLSGRTGVSIDRARIETRTMKQTEGESMVTRRAKVFAAIVREMPIDICPDELIVGCFSGRPMCWNVSPADGLNLFKVIGVGAKVAAKLWNRD